MPYMTTSDQDLLHKITRVTPRVKAGEEGPYEQAKKPFCRKIYESHAPGPSQATLVKERHRMNRGQTKRLFWLPSCA